jgi:hypothetical protein
VEEIFKFGAPNPEDQPWTYPNVWATEETTGGGQRIVIAPAHDQVEVLIQLLQAVDGPFGALYVLVIPRGQSEPGRYQSPYPQTADTMKSFLRDFKTFLEIDGRHHLWIASASTSDLLIYDRHNVIYAYGPSEEWKLLLSQSGMNEVASIPFPSPHSHHYHQSMDSEEHRMVAYWKWNLTRLKKADEE